MDKHEIISGMSTVFSRRPAAKGGCLERNQYKVKRPSTNTKFLRVCRQSYWISQVLELSLKVSLVILSNPYE